MNPAVIAVVKYVLPPLVWLLSLLIPRRNSRVAVCEAKNKAEIMALVNQVESVFPPSGTYVPLPKLVDNCYALGPFPALWAIEGLGNYYAETFRERGEVPKNLLTDPKVSAIPAKSLTMLHAGIGLSFAKRSLEGLTHTSPVLEIRKALEKFVILCKDSGRPGYIGASLESLGLVTFILHTPELALLLDRELSEIDPEAASFMWRGAGRALYFHPKNFLPSLRTPWRAIEMCEQMGPHETAKKNLRAGFSWAITLVNMKHPEVMETLLLYQGEQFPERDLFINGVTSSMIMRYDTTPDDSTITEFINHQPNPSNQLLCKLWKSHLKEPCEIALQEIYPVLRQYNCLQEVFQYQSLHELVARLKCAAAPA